MFFRKLVAESTGYQVSHYNRLTQPCFAHSFGFWAKGRWGIESIHDMDSSVTFPPVPGKKKYGDVMEGILIKFQWTNPTLRLSKKMAEIFHAPMRD